jgi:hypothetical protein
VVLKSIFSLGARPPHGGKRAGAGRKPKWSFDDVLAVGQMCEARWRAAEVAEFEKNNATMFSEQSDITSHQVSAREVPIPDRRAWLKSESGERHRDDMEVELECLNEQLSGAPTQNPVFSISKKPPRGTRKKVLEEVAAKFCITVKQADNLWQEYRRFLRK